MKKVFSKKILIPFMALFLCIAVAFGTAAVSARSTANANITIYVNPDDTVKRNSESDEDAIYVGHGLNGWDMALGPDAIEDTGMSDAYFEIFAQRIIKSKPKVVRFMINPYYMCFLDDEDGGEARWNASSGENKTWEDAQLNFDSPYMYNFWRYLEVYQAAGTQVMLNYGYVNMQPMAEWYSIKDVPSSPGDIANSGYTTRSAPRNLEAFANNLAALLKECEERGFIGGTREESTIQYINFYNEVHGTPEFLTFADKRPYLATKLKYVHNALVSAGLRTGGNAGKNNRNLHKILLVAMDGANGAIIGDDLIYFFDYLYENAYKPGYCDLFNTHQYLHPGHGGVDMNGITTGSEQEINISYLNENYKTNVPGSLNVILGESGLCQCRNTHTGSADGKNDFIGYASPFDGTTVSQSIGATLGGVLGTCDWDYFPMYFPREVNWLHAPRPIRWYYPTYKKGGVFKNGIEDVRSTYGEVGIYTRYVPANSKVAKSSVDNANKDNVLLASYMNDDDTAIVAEFDYASGFNYSKFKAGQDSTKRTVRINLEDKNLTGKQYYKYVFEYAESSFIDSDEANSMYDGNAILPDGEPIAVKGTGDNAYIEDTISGNHCLVIYSTIEPAKQVALADDSRYIEYSKSRNTAGVEIKVDTAECVGLENAEYEFDVFRGVVDSYEEGAKETEFLETYLKEAKLRNYYLKTDCSEYKEDSYDTATNTYSGATLNKRAGEIVSVSADTTYATYKCASDAKVGDTIAVRVKLKGDTNLLSSVDNGTKKLQVYDTDIYAIAIIKVVA